MSQERSSHPAVWTEGDATFRTTCWSLVLRAGDRSSPERLAALEDLCCLYWYPLYAYARSQGHAVEDARDLTQEFFARLLEKNYLGVADQRRGKFRWFLLTAFKCFLANEYDRSRAAKRGGGCTWIALDLETAEQQYGMESGLSGHPEQMFDRRWALLLLGRVRDKLRSDGQAQGKAERFRQLEPWLTGEAVEESYASVGAKLGMTEGAVRVEIHRMKRRFGELLRAEITRTVGRESEIDEEVRYLIRVMAE